MALESLSNPLQALAAQPYVMNLRSQTALTNDVTWDAATQYFLNDVVRSPLTGGMYVYEGWDQATATSLPYTILSVNDPASALGAADGWAPFQGAGLKNVIVSASAAIVGGTVAGALTGPLATLGVTFAPAGGLGVTSTWLVSLTYNATLATPPFAGTEGVNWTFTPNGTGPVASSCSQSFAALTTAGANVTCLVNCPADATQITVTGVQSAAATVLTFAGGVVATYSRIQ
jgi:hypothetical protein